MSKPLIVVLWVILAAVAAQAEVPSRVTVNLPVTATVENATLEPGAYTMVIENFDGSSATVKIYTEGSQKLRVAAPAQAAKGSDPAAHNAVKVTVRDGAYFLDMLLLAGETTRLQFRN